MYIKRNMYECVYEYSCRFSSGVRWKTNWLKGELLKERLIVLGFDVFFQ